MFCFLCLLKKKQIIFYNREKKNLNDKWKTLVETQWVTFRYFFLLKMTAIQMAGNRWHLFILLCTRMCLMTSESIKMKNDYNALMKPPNKSEWDVACNSRLQMSLCLSVSTKQFEQPWLMLRLLMVYWGWERLCNSLSTHTCLSSFLLMVWGNYFL